MTILNHLACTEFNLYVLNASLRTYVVLVNDELVKDEIATVASGNVKSYKELESVILPNNMCLVTLQAVVSTQKLVAYAKSKGASCEFAGATLMANRRLMLLNKTNTEKVFENLMFQLEELAPFIFDYKLNVGEPSLDGKYKDKYIFPITLIATSNENTERFANLLYSTLNAVALSDLEAKEAERILGEKMFKLELEKTHISDISTAHDSQTKSRLYFHTQFDVDRLEEIIDIAMNGIKIEDNLGTHYRMPTGKWNSPHFGVCCVKYYENGKYEDIIQIKLPDFSKPQPLFKSKKNSAPQAHKPLIMSKAHGRISVSINDVDKLANFEVSRKQNLVFPSQIIDNLNRNGLLEKLAEETKNVRYQQNAKFINYKNQPYLIALSQSEADHITCLMEKTPFQLLHEVVIIEAEDEDKTPYDIIGSIVRKLLVEPDEKSVEEAKRCTNWELYNEGYEYIVEYGYEYVTFNKERRMYIIMSILDGLPVKKSHYKDWNVYFIDVNDIGDGQKWIF